ncbi:MAG TPA: sulfotransferase [Steroidobacteraceae bacterium]|jgi:tetratricopeptide (TPR) repeat protein|nr:sulfotransferase [Steroidobacteraceae bacterium]
MSKAAFIETLERGVTAHQAGRLDDALESYRAALALRPNDPEAASLCGLALLHSGKGEEAMPLLQQAVDREPGQSGYRLNLAEGLAQTGKADRAMVELGLVIAVEPTNTRALSRFYELECAALIERREWAKLYANGVAWTKVDPKSPAAWRALSRGAFEDGRLREATAAFARALSFDKPTAPDLTAYAALCLKAFEMEAAAAALDQAEALDPDFPPMLATGALLMMYLGRFDEAEEHCRRCLARQPDFVPAYTTLSSVRRGAIDDADLQALHELARRQGSYLGSRIPAVFAIAHAYDARGEIDAAFATYQAAHKLATQRDALDKRDADVRQDLARIEQIVKVSQTLPEIAPVTNAPRPIFVVGMPRSGTTVIESVLGAHSRVFACGERSAMRQILRYLLGIADAGGTVDAQTLQEWAKFYLRDLPNVGRADHVTDKHPRNLEAVGLIARMLPNAVIVHVRRDPVETCFSVYRHELNRRWTFTHSLPHIAEYSRRYAQLAAQWERELPGRFLTIQYEDFVTNFATAAPALLQACGLSWEPQCLEFQKALRVIATPSSVQARGPVVLGNGRAQKYRKHLGPLVTALEAADIDLETGAIKN